MLMPARGPSKKMLPSTVALQLIAEKYLRTTMGNMCGNPGTTLKGPRHGANDKHVAILLRF